MAKKKPAKKAKAAPAKKVTPVKKKAPPKPPAVEDNTKDLNSGPPGLRR